MYKRIGSDAKSDTYMQDGQILTIEREMPQMMTEYYTASIVKNYYEITQEERLRFFREMWAVKSMSLENVPLITDVQEDADGIRVYWQPFYGISLREYINNGGMMCEPAAAITALAGLMADLETAHQSGLYFCVLPDTLCIADGGDVKLNAMASPAADVNTTIKALAGAVFLLVEGIPFGNVSEIKHLSPAMETFLSNIMYDKKILENISDFQAHAQRIARVSRHASRFADRGRDKSDKKDKKTHAPRFRAVIAGGLALILTLTLFAALLITAANNEPITNSVLEAAAVTAAK